MISNDNKERNAKAQYVLSSFIQIQLIIFSINLFLSAGLII